MRPVRRRHDEAGSRHDGATEMSPRGIHVAVALVGALALCAWQVGESRAAEPEAPHAVSPQAATPLNLECTNIRRLSDNFALDLKIRFMFRPRGRSYVRLENAGRGWHLIDERPYETLTPAKVVLSDSQALTSYVERLTGDYYHIDHTGTGLSVWGRCVPVSGFYRNF